MNIPSDTSLSHQHDRTTGTAGRSIPGLRELRFFRRLVELFIVLALVLAGTLFHLLFGWVALVFRYYGKPKTMKPAYVPQRQ